MEDRICSNIEEAIAEVEQCKIDVEECLSTPVDREELSRAKAVLRSAKRELRDWGKAEPKKTCRRTKLYNARKERGLTMRRLTADLGIAPGQLSVYETALSEPRVSTAIKLARYFGKSVEELFSEV